MATPEDHEALYRTLRNAILSRHLAGGKYFRSNLFAESNQLDPAATVDVRCRLQYRDLENPLLWGANLAVALSVECALGNTEAHSALSAMLASIRSLYRFQRGDAFDGYPIRWTPVDSDRWQTGSDGAPLYSQNMLLDNSGEYIYALPTTDPRAVPWRAWDTLEKLLGEDLFAEYRDSFWNFFDLHRRWEVSADELVGLLGTYAAIHDLSGDSALKAEVAAQIAPLSRYLSANAYLLVRPCGGFNARGPAGMAPAVELPFRRLLQRATGGDVSSAGFVDALVNAGVWAAIGDPVNEFVGGMSAALVLGAPVIGPILVGVLGTAAGLLAGTLTAALGPLGDVVLGEMGLSSAIIGGEFSRFAPDPFAVLRAIAIYLHRDAFDVKHNFGEHDSWHAASDAGEFAIACILHGLDAQNRYEAFLTAAPFIKADQPPNSFPPYLQLCAADDPAATQAFLAWFNAWQGKRPAGSDTTTDVGSGRPWQCFPAAVAALAGGGTDVENELLRRLDARYTLINGSHAGDLELIEKPDEGSRRESALSAVDYLSALALAWLHAQRCAARGASLPPGFPALVSDIQTWPKATLPAAAVDTTFPARFGFAGSQPAPASGIEVFGDQTPVDKAVVPPPVLEAVEKPLICDVIVALPRKHTIDVFSGISLQNGDEWSVEVVKVTGKGAGPSGLDNLVSDKTYPLHVGLDPIQAYERALLARLGGWIFIGASRGREAFWYPHDKPTKLYFRLNSPISTGRGRFLIRVRVWGHRPPTVDLPLYNVTGVTRAGTLSPSKRFNKRVVRLCGGPVDDPWHIEIGEAIRLIEEGGHLFLVPGNPQRRLVVVYGPKRTYLRAVGDQARGNELQSVPACTHYYP